MIRYLELPKQLQHNERPPAARFLNTENLSAQELMVRTSQSVQELCGDLLVGNCMDLRYKSVKELGGGAGSVTVATGPIPKEADSWVWSVDFRSKERTELLHCKVMWGGSNWQKRGRFEQGTLWRPTVSLDEHSATPAMQCEGASADWQIITRDHQGGQHRTGYVNDADGELANFVSKVLEYSDVHESALEITSKRTESTIENTARSRQIGFVGLGVIPAQHARPQGFVDFRQRAERVVEVSSFLPFAQLLLDSGQLGFKAWTRGI